MAKKWSANLQTVIFRASVRNCCLETIALAQRGWAGYNRDMGTWDEAIGKTVGRRVNAESSIPEAAALLETIARLVPPGICPKGVWRFRTFEEADEWALTQAARSPESRS